MAVYEEPVGPTTALPSQEADVPFPTDGWPTGPPPDHLAERLTALLDEAFVHPNTDEDSANDPSERFGLSLSFVAIHRGRLVAERYAASSGPDEQLISWSMAKSFTQALIGIAAAEGKLDIHGPAAVPEWSASDDPRATITVDQLLRMVSGMTFNEDYVDEDTSHCIDMLFGAGNPDMGAYAAALPPERTPNSHFNYSSGTSVIICRILADLYGRGPDFEAWMNDVLLGPLGIDASLTFDDAGTWVGSSFLDASARDFAKFGLLYLRDGMWGDTRLLPPGWVDYARTAQAEDDEGSVYGAHWWLRSDDRNVFYAAGYETQRILIDPEADLVLVRLGKTPTELGVNVDAWLDEIRLLFPRNQGANLARD